MDKQKKQAKPIGENLGVKGVSTATAEKRAWKTINKQSGGGEKAASGKDVTPKVKEAARKDSADKAFATRRKNRLAPEGFSSLPPLSEKELEAIYERAHPPRPD